MKKYFQYIILLISGFFLVSCRAEMLSILADKSCQAPCWRGISIRQNESEVIEKLQGMPDIDTNSITINRTDRPYLERVIDWQFINFEGYGNIIMNSDLVSSIRFPLFQKISLKNLFEIYGKPDSVIIEKQKLDGIYIQVFVIYENDGICLEYQPTLIPFIDFQTYWIKPTDLINEIHYVDTSIPYWQSNMCNIGFGGKEYSMYVTQWKGYTKYSVFQSSVNP